MNSVAEFIHNLWIKARLKAPPSVQRKLIVRLHKVKEIVRLVVRPYLPVYQISGQGQGGPLDVTYVGLEYAKPFLKSLLFTENPAERRVGQIPFWRRDELANLSSGDVIVVEAARHLIDKLPRQKAIVLPQYVHHILDARGEWQDVRRRFHKSVRNYELRLMRKHGYQHAVSHDDRDFEEFYRQMYSPTMDDRHGEQSSPMSFTEAYQYFRQGWLFRVTRDGTWVSGVVCHPAQNTVCVDIGGVRDADLQLIKEGAMAALYYVAIHWANQHGYDAVNFLGTGPYLGIGMFQYKRKWGGAISVPPHLHRQIWIRVRRSTPAVAQFLKETPFVVVDGNGKLHGLIVVDDPHSVSDEIREGWEKRYSTPGLSSLLIRPVRTYTEDPTNESDSGLSISICGAE